MPPSGPERVVAITRSPAGLHVILASGQRPDRPDAGPLFAVTERRALLASVPLSVVPSRDRLLACHAALAQASVADPRTLAALLWLIEETVPEAAGKPGSTPRSALADAPVRPRATAAHPRAYRGTRRKPPRARQPATFDARELLGHARQEQEISRSLLGRLGEALAELAEMGATPAWLARVAERPEEAFVSPGARASVSPGFTRAWGWLLREAPSPLGREAAVAFAALSLDEDGDLRRLLTLIWAEQRDARTLAWVREIAQWPPERRASVARVLLAGSFFRRAPEAFDGLLHDAGVPDPERRLFAYLEGRARGAGARYLEAGLRIAARYAPAYGFGLLVNEHPAPGSAPLQPGVDDDPVDVIEALLGHIGPEHHPPGFAPLLWERVGQLPGLGDLLRAAPWRHLSPSAANLFVEIFTGAVHHDVAGEALQRKWQVMRAAGPAVAELAAQAPPGHEEKILHFVRDALWTWDDPEALRERLPWVLRAARRLARPPFDPRARPFELLAGFFAAPFADADRERLLALPDTTWKAVETACRRENDQRLVARGLPPLARALGPFALSCLGRYPAALCRAGGLLGCLLPASRSRVLRAFAAEPLLSFDLHRGPAAEACAALRPLLPGPTNPFGRKLTAHLAGAVALTEEQLRRQLRRVNEKLDLTRLELLERMVVAELAGDLPLGDDPAGYRHALQLLPWSDGNRRALRRFLRAHAAGQHGYLDQHPATRAWLHTHPWVDEGTWLRGVEVTSTLALRGQGGEARLVRIAVERDPLEALKLGTYVGSCLGVGGLCAYSAAAAVLDVNKQVLYARTTDGQVVARQLVALAEERRLVCFHVYPAGCDEALVALFMEYDRRFAEALGVPLHDGGDDEAGYTLAFVLAHEQWEDPALRVPDGETAAPD